jgi:HPt (histidine-containing phosphotransfer) domain-containing protein
MAEARRLASGDPPPDAVVVDESATGSVPDLCAAVRDLSAAVRAPCVVLASLREAPASAADLLMASGAAGVLSWPPSPADIAAAVETARGAAAASAAEDRTVIDREILMEAAGEDPAEARELLELFLSTSNDRQADLASALDGKRLGDARKAAHSWAGAAATCGLRALRAVLSEIEDHAESGRLEPAVEAMDRARREMDRVRASMRTEWNA